ncbi:TetR/AcrR family transcriptional regulator [Clavibacter michiganensis subsp. phaseoli]|uniref:TetR/AcrR family transcriptional regulator n=1 Tax=Clavibacter phaseoli TaxID=1734031 RepID=A0A8I0SFT2_9MICO|nr:TetR/AcrR family transcriptional regulator [Clavibacter phaseoli]MBF4629622.1 TetR/AcrR family transcriptional regulator [Clavibacter phaseoli]
MTFQRARSDEQRQIRRRVILDTAASMLQEMSVAEVTLNELSRRVGLAKSNVLRYFESREAVLLDLMDEYFASWLVVLETELGDELDGSSRPAVRAARMAEVLSRSLAQQVVLCDLFGAQGGVLEHNVSVEVVKAHKRSSLAKLATMTDLVRRHLPELGEGAQMFCFMTVVSAGALSTYVPPPPSLVAAYADEPELGVLNLELVDALRAVFTSALVGALPRPDVDPLAHLG